MQEICGKTGLEESQKLRVSWSPDGKILAVPGETYLRVFTMKDLQEMQEMKEISHSSAISMTYWISDNIIVTLDVDNTAKIWNYDTKMMVYTHTFENQIVSMEHSPELKTLALFDSEGTLHTCSKDFQTEKSLLSAEKKISHLDIESADKKFDNDLADVISE
jgi:WD40 repeat protein